ncbi:MAG TPA: hypothetical protein DEO86_22560 [Colwellia sp.]|nr:hypothetical protein [Colwellia sp.]|tara:strand:+ start:8397 stop:8609 length:213 start_codon:yes stop_codon:yes gene_type:complete
MLNKTYHNQFNINLILSKKSSSVWLQKQPKIKPLDAQKQKEDFEETFMSISSATIKAIQCYTKLEVKLRG